MQPYHLEQLAELCRAHPVHQKVVFVPNLQVGYNLTTALAAGGQTWANLRTTTPEAWAALQVGPQFEAEGWRPPLQDVELFYLENILNRVLSETSDGYFSDLPIGLGLIRSFLQTVQLLSLAGVEPDTLEQAGIEPGKVRFLSQLCREYRAHLASARYYNPADLFRKAEALLEQEERDDGTVFAIFDETPLQGIAFRYVKRLTEGRLYRIGRSQYGMAPPAHSAAARFPDVPFPAPPAAVGPGGRLLVDGLCPQDGETFRVEKAMGPENEVRAVFREILHGETPLDSVEIAYTTETPYVPLIHDTAAALDIPVAFATGIPVMLTRPGQALAGFYRWIGSGLDTEELVGLCRAGLLTFSEVLEPGETLEPYRMAMLLEQGTIGRGGVDYRTGLDRLERRIQLQIKEREEHGRSVADLRSEQTWLRESRRVLDVLLALVPRHDLPVSQVTEASIRFLRTFVPTRSEHDATATESLADRLERITVDVEGPAERLVQRLGDLVAQHRIEASVARPGHVYAVPVERAGYTHREHLYVLGMDEGSFPGGATEDPILLDDERTQLSEELGLQRSRPGEQVWHLVRCLGMASGNVTLLAACRSLTDNRETYPCALFQQAAEQLGETEPDNVPTILSVPEPDRALNDVEAMLSVRKGVGFREAVHTVFPWLVRGHEAVLARQQPGLSRFHGWLGRETPNLDIADGETVLSASRLEVLAACPYRYFLQYVLQLEPAEGPEEDPTRWLTPLEFGALLHSLFCTFMRTLQTRGESPDRSRHADLMDGLLQEEIDRYRERIPVTHEAAYRSDCDRLRQAGRIFLAVEAGRKGIKPVGFEVSFGFGEEEGLNQADAVKLHLSDRLQLALRGRIDRVDLAGEGYEIWDYKTGSLWGYDERDLLRKGTRLQWALYAYVLEEMLSNRGIHVIRSGYFFPGDRGNGRRIGDVPPGREQLGELLEPLLDLLPRGCFFHVLKEDPCTYCDYGCICSEEKPLKKLDDLQEIAEDKTEILNSLGRWING